MCFAVSCLKQIYYISVFIIRTCIISVVYEWTMACREPLFPILHEKVNTLLLLTFGMLLILYRYNTSVRPF